VSLKKTLMVSGATAFGLMSVLATSAVAADDSAKSTTTTVGEVTVTAEKRVQKLEQVAVAISAYSAKDRDLKGIESIQDIAKFTPGMSYGGPNGAISIRGVSRVTNAFGTDPGVAEYYNGVYESDTSFVALPTFFADHTEILRGPQGTLFGRNSIGGAANVVTFKPTDTFQGEFEETVGNYETSTTDIRVSGPITNQIDFLAAAAYGYQGKGYIHNVAGPDTGTNATPSLEAQLTYKPTDKISVWLTYHVDFLNARPAIGNASAPYLSTSGTSAAAQTFDGLVLSPYWNFTATNPGSNNIYKDAISYPGSTKETTPTQYASVHLDWDLGPATLKYIGGITRYVVSVKESFDYTDRGDYQMPYAGGGGAGSAYPSGFITVSPQNIIAVQEDSIDWSNELDLVSNGNGPFKWIVGLYQYGEDTSGGFQLANPGQPELKTPLNLTTFATESNPNGNWLVSDSELRTHSYAVFGQVDEDFSNHISVSAGLRYSVDQKAGHENSDLVYFDPNATFGSTAYDLGGKSDDDVGEWKGLSGELSIQYRPNADTNLYAKVSRGYKSGGFALGNFDPFPDVKPEYLWDYEAGWKQLIGHQWEFNTAAFYYDYTNLQASLNFQALGSSVDLTQLIGLPKSRAFGFEEEAVYSPTPDLSFTLSYGFLDATITQGPSGVLTDTTAVAPTPISYQNGTAHSLVGQELPLSPRNKVALNALYTWHFEPGSLSWSTSYSWTAESYASIFDTALNRMPAYSDVDTRLTWADKDKKYNLILYVSNLFDVTSMNSVGPGGAWQPLPGFNAARLEILNPPRTFGASLKYFF